MSNKSNKTRFGRRGALGALATVGGGLMLRALATGIPAKILLDPLSASAEEDLPDGKICILSVSSQGDPFNANVPGTYGLPELYHPADPAMVATNMNLGGQTFEAAKPWADLPQHIQDRLCFFHHATYTPVHGETARVQKMMGATEKNDMLISLLANELAPRIGTVQREPVSLGANGGELLSAGGRILGNVAPRSVQQALGGVEGPLKDLTAMRDKHIDEIYKLYKAHGTPSQRTLLDAWARSRDEVRGISTSLVERLDLIDGNDAANQMRTAAILAAMKIAPAITVHLRFGRDNHNDTDFEDETADHLESIPLLQTLMEELDALRAENSLQHDVIVGSLNVFGRTLKKKGMNGRDHNAGHHVLMMMGEGVKPGVIGGVHLNPSGKEYVAQTIDSQTGAAMGETGDIQFEDTLASAGKTLGALLGVTEERLDELLPTGKVVQAALA